MIRKIWLLILLLVASGCSHPLEVRNINQYKASRQSFAKELIVGVTTPNTVNDGKVLVDGTVQHLGFYSGKVIYPAMPDRPCDVLCRVTVSPRHKGSAGNFLVNFPGFLVWAPAWHGYIYKPGYDIDVDLTTPQGEPLDSFSLPIDLDVRHADLDRSWTELSWLEVGVIALVGGVVFTQYDDDVTALVEADTKRHLGGYIAQEIMARIAHLQPQAHSVEPQTLPLNGRNESPPQHKPRGNPGIVSSSGNLY